MCLSRISYLFMFRKHIILPSLNLQKKALLLKLRFEVSIHSFKRNKIFAANCILFIGEARNIISICISICSTYNKKILIAIYASL